MISTQWQNRQINQWQYTQIKNNKSIQFGKLISQPESGCSAPRVLLARKHSANWRLGFGRGNKRAQIQSNSRTFGITIEKISPGILSIHLLNWSEKPLSALHQLMSSIGRPSQSYQSPSSSPLPFMGLRWVIFSLSKTLQGGLQVGAISVLGPPPGGFFSAPLMNWWWLAVSSKAYTWCVSYLRFC